MRRERNEWSNKFEAGDVTIDLKEDAARCIEKRADGRREKKGDMRRKQGATDNKNNKKNTTTTKRIVRRDR